MGKQAIDQRIVQSVRIWIAKLKAKSAERAFRKICNQADSLALSNGKQYWVVKSPYGLEIIDNTMRKAINRNRKKKGLPEITIKTLVDGANYATSNTGLNRNIDKPKPNFFAWVFGIITVIILTYILTSWLSF